MCCSDPDFTDTANLADNLGHITKAMKKGMSAVNHAVFDGSKKSVSTLGKLIHNGAFLDVDHDGDGSFELEQDLHKPLYARLIPTAWANPTEGGHDNKGVFVLDSEYDCKADDPCTDGSEVYPDALSMYIAGSTRKATCSCVDGHMYYLVQLVGSSKIHCAGGATGGPSCDRNLFTVPKGLDKLDGKEWAGLTKEKFVKG